jgi:hypothetical protein
MAITSTDGDPLVSQGSPEFAWRGAPALRRVHALNERCIELLASFARNDKQRTHLAIINQHRDLWRSLTATERRRAARTPFLLVDVRFQDADWWRSASSSRPNHRIKLALQEAFTGKIAAELMRETLMLAWSTVAFERGGASILFGMTPVVARIISELGPQEVERIAARHSRHLRPRWEEYPAFWGRLLAAVRGEDEEVLHDVHLHGAQLLGSELLPRLQGRFL